MQFYFVLATNVMNLQEQQGNSWDSEEFSHEKKRVKLFALRALQKGSFWGEI